MLALRRRVAAVVMPAPPRTTARPQVPQHGDQLCSRARVCCRATNSQPAQPKMAPLRMRPPQSQRTGSQALTTGSSSQQPQPQLQHQPPRLHSPRPGERRRTPCRLMASGGCHGRGPTRTRRTRSRACRQSVGSDAPMQSLPNRLLAQVGGTPASRKQGAVRGTGTGCAQDDAFRSFTCSTGEYAAIAGQHGDAGAPAAEFGVPGTRDGFATKSFEINRWDWQHLLIDHAHGRQCSWQIS
jgi:hypothetical protein